MLGKKTEIKGTRDISSSITWVRKMKYIQHIGRNMVCLFFKQTIDNAISI